MIVREVLDNGLRLVTESMPHVRSVSIGVWLALSGCPGRLARTSFQLSSLGSFAKLGGTGPAAFHGWSSAGAVSQAPPG